MQFFTQVKIDRLPIQLSHDLRMAALGSCFTEHLAAKLRDHKFDIIDNPFGISYNPSSIQRSLSEIMQQKKYTYDDLSLHQGLYHTWQHHGSFAHPDAEICLAQINERIRDAYPYVRHGQVLFITWGTAMVYIYQPTGELVNNCYKYPAVNFIHRRLTCTEIVDAYRQLLHHLWFLNSELHIVLTISPVRHWREGLIENNLSKATLILAAHQLAREFAMVHYFPAYEIVIDELRDYRFYTSDLVHPNAQAIDYVWEKFQQAAFAEDTLKLLKQIEKIQRARQHRPLHGDTSAHALFKQKLYAEVAELAKIYPSLNWQADLEHFKPDAQK